MNISAWFGPHSHKCSCGAIWVHDPAKVTDSQKEHECPTCGKEQWYKNNCADDPEYASDCKVACRMTV
jgi:hypothetical protein